VGARNQTCENHNKNDHKKWLEWDNCWGMEWGMRWRMKWGMKWGWENGIKFSQLISDKWHFHAQISETKCHDTRAQQVPIIVVY
jgi:hypothetical protein